MFHLILLVLLAILIGCSHTPDTTYPSRAQVVKVHDGDTITVVFQGTSHRVRLAGIDCPESNQEYGEEATETTKSLALNQDVRMTAIEVDHYARMVAEVRFLDGRSLNHELVKAGACWWYRKYAPSDTELTA
jgi:endonuclease YncB( thermonuclease family)